LRICCYHLLKKFHPGWADGQLPDGTVIWTAPSGQAYTTYPGSRLLFPSVCRPTAPVSAPADAPKAQPSRGLMMSRRKSTRAQERAKRIGAERARNRDLRENPGNDSDDPPPF
jgi:hypothetical protein